MLRSSIHTVLLALLWLGTGVLMLVHLVLFLAGWTDADGPLFFAGVVTLALMTIVESALYVWQRYRESRSAP